MNTCIFMYTHIIHTRVYTFLKLVKPCKAKFTQKQPTQIYTKYY